MACGFCGDHVWNCLGELLPEWVAKHLDYVRHFHKNVETLKTKGGELETARTRLQHEIEDAELRQLQQIEDDVRSTKSKADQMLKRVQSMEKIIEHCPNPSWWQQYRFSKELVEETVPEISGLLEKMAKFGQPGRLGYAAIPTIESPKDFWASKSSKEAANQIFSALKYENFSMIALCGMGGVGKTTLVHKVGSQAKKLDLFDKVVIATVSKEPNFEKIQDEIAKYLDFEMMAGQARRSKQEFRSRLQKEKRILIILDDVWANINLEDIGIPFGEDHKGCKILLTTRRHQVCQSMDCQKKINLGCLDEHEAWALFERKAGLGNSDDAIKKVAIEVVQKCHGLPLSIVTLGTSLKGKTLPMWEATCRRLKTNRSMEIEDVERNAYLCLEESFNYLKDKKTKICFLLCSLFPEDYKIYMEDLVRFAWGLDLYKGIIDSIEGARSEVHAAMDILKDSSLLLDCGERHVKIHDTVRDVALWIASNREDIGFVIKSGVVGTSPNNECFDSCTAISFLTSSTTTLPNGLVCPNLKILLLGGGDGLTTSAFFEGMKALKVCSLHDGSISEDAFQFHTNLRSLHLYGCKIFDISLLGKLKDLQVLSLNRCSDIIELPDEIGDLNNLRLLELSNCYELQRIPPGLLPKLSQLEVLYLDGCALLRWATSDQEGRWPSLSELNSLSKLTVLSLWVYASQIPKDFVFQKLQRFNICIMDTDFLTEERIYRWWQKKVENCPISKSLRVEASVLYAFQQLIGDVDQSLYLENLVGCQNLVPDQLGVSSKLTDLELQRCKDMKCLIDTSKESEALITNIAFCDLVKLSVRNMSGLEELCHGPKPRVFTKIKNLGYSILQKYHLPNSNSTKP